MQKQTTNKYTWNTFIRQVKPRQGCTLFNKLGQFNNSVLVSGCQRSGTTMLSRIITESAGMVHYWFSDDDELDAALVLAGVVEHTPAGRYCFQTTYLNDCYHEYYEHQNEYRLIWVLRNPYSVVYSMMYNWGKSALNDLFETCGLAVLEKKENVKLNTIKKISLSKVKKACYAYVGKIEQSFELQQNLPADTFLFVEYDTLVARKSTLLPALYDFISLPYKKEYADKIHAKSVQKADKLSKHEKSIVARLCEPIYHDALSRLLIK